jgi:GntR family transcriptional regulator
MPDPMWRQIAEDLRQKIESGELGSDGRALPSELELREMYDASRNTVRDAVKWLVTRGLVVTRPGQGTFVVKKIDPFVTTLSTDIGGARETTAYASEVAARRRKPEVTIPRVEIQQASGIVADELGLAAGDTVVSRHQERLIDATPWSLQTTFYPMRLVDMGAVRLIRAEEIATGAVAYVEEILGIKQVGWRDKLLVRTPDIRETAFFALPDDGRIAVVEIARTGYDESGKPFRVTITTYPADRNQFVLIAGDIPAEEASDA